MLNHFIYRFTHYIPNGKRRVIPLGYVVLLNLLKKFVRIIGLYSNCADERETKVALQF